MVHKKRKHIIKEISVEAKNSLTEKYLEMAKNSPITEKYK
jgi:hypothetical protein